jgi:ethanolamine phosphate transferase 2 subunit G
MKSLTLRLAIVLVSSILQLIGIGIFAKGFFPYKKVLSGFATKNGPQDFKEFGLIPREAAPRLFDRLVFIVIDALRRFSFV